MIIRLPRPGFKVWATLFTLVGGIIFSFVAMSFLVFLYMRTEGTERAVLSTLMISSIAVAWVVVAAQVWTIYAKERLLFEERIDRFKEQHPKGVRFAKCWSFSFLCSMLLGLYVRMSWAPGNVENNFVVGFITVAFSGLIIWYAVRRTRKIMRRRRSRHYDYES